ncbi:penicillin-binding protein activator [Marinobacterium marinum]|uniref:Penicillin-binding protein activator n=1 Tax=Marinobacterium marinum TaxID=2756129 RepID=A0A7W1WZ07_9GAMM|nr:penicillin-binding protein activator [Marinobacterium marinum]MBA4502817.1 penicillin-binding protein activator [Marinobacterium marinum]
MKRVLQKLLWGLLLLLPGWVVATEADVALLRQQLGSLGERPSVQALERTWQSLQQLPTAKLVALSRHESNNYYEQGWFELARDVRVASGQPQPQLEAWRQRWFHHPAMHWLPHLQTSAATASVPVEARRLGVLLPLTGEFAEQGQEVLAGVRAALEQDRQRGFATPRLQVYDSATVESLPAFLNTLVGQEAPDILVGPLRADLSRQLMLAYRLPILALNRVGQGAFNGYQLDLASDQELRQLLDRVWQDGHRRVLLLAPEQERWVEPLLQELERLGRERGLVIQARMRYSAAPARLREQLGRVLSAAASRQRAEEPGQHEPLLRQDIDAVLLIARPEEARQVKPILDYQGASGWPVYAGSYLFSGRIDPVSDRDLDGVVFCDMPWRLRQSSGQMPSSRFFALGLDAGSVYRALPTMSAGTPGYFEGETGQLRLTGGPRLQRTLWCARFAGGKPRVVRAAP